jgi:hypothetical protein
VIRVLGGRVAWTSKKDCYFLVPSKGWSALHRRRLDGPAMVTRMVEAPGRWSRVNHAPYVDRDGKPHVYRAFLGALSARCPSWTNI